MASGIQNLISAVTTSTSVPAGAASVRRADGPTQAQSQSSGSVTVQSAPEKYSGPSRWDEAAQANRETLAAILEFAQRATLASDTTIYYERDDQNGRMYLHVMDKRTGEELYRIPKDYLPADPANPAQAHRLDVQI